MEPTEPARLPRRRQELSDTWDARASSKSVVDIDEKTLRDYIAKGNACGRIADAYTTPEEALQSLGLLRGRNLTNAADVLFCKSPDIRLRLSLLESHTRPNVLESQQVSGTVFDLVHRADLYILSNTRRRLVFNGLGPRDEIPEIPREAVREALYLAYCHMDWAQHSFVSVNIYYDSVDILTPGWIIDGPAPRRRHADTHRNAPTRNELIARTLVRSKEIEGYGSGMSRITELCDGAAVRVDCRQLSDGTLVAFHRKDPFTGVEFYSPWFDSAEAGETLDESLN